MKLKRRNKAKAEFNMSAMTDIVLLLLIFFIINYDFPNAIPLLLPNATGQVAQNKSITVLVSADLQYLVNNEKVGFSGLKSKLSAEINKAKSKTDKPSVILKIDKSVALEKVVDVLQIGNELKVPMILSTKPKK
jgi:biopolymer transport protein ExbD